MTEIGASIAKQAGSEGGWVAAVFVVLVICGFTAFGWLGQQLWVDHRDLNKFVRTTLVGIIEANGAAFQKLFELMKTRACLSEDVDTLDEMARERERSHADGE